MSFLKESPRDPRSTTAAQIRARVGRTLSMALAVALTAILLPAAISLAKTGHFGRIPVVDVITGAATETSNTDAQDQQDHHGKQQDTPAAQLPAAASDNAEAALAQAGLPKLKDDRSVAARLSRGPGNRHNGADDSNGNGGSSDDSADDSRHFADDPASGVTAPVDDNPSSDDTSGDDSGKQDDNSGSDNSGSDNSGSDHSGSDNSGSGTTPADDHGNNGKGNDDGAKHDTPKPVNPAPAVSPQPATDTPAAPAPATDSAAPATPASDVPADASTAGDTRRFFVLDPTESASLIVDVPEGANLLTLWAHAAGAGCAPRISVTVDGQPAADGDMTLDGTAWQRYAITPVPTAGVHVVRVTSLGTDPAAGSSCDASQDVVTIVEPKLGAEGDNPPADDATTVGTDTTPTTGTDDGTLDQGSGDTTGTDTTGTDTTGTGTDDGTLDQGSGDATGTDTTGNTTADGRRQFSLFARENVSLAEAEAADGGPLTLWLRSSSAQCDPRVVISVDNTVQKVVDVKSTDWQSETVDVPATGTSHHIVVGFLRLKGNCDGTETLTVVEPKGGDAGAASPAPIVPVPAPATGQPADGGTTPGTPDAGSGSTPPVTSTPTGATVDGSMESSLSSFGFHTEMGAAPAQREAQTVRAGSFATSMTVTPGEKRSELQPSGVKVMPGTTAWFADSIYLEPGFPTTANASNGFQTLMQWKDAGGTVSSSPPVALNVTNGRYNLHGGFGCPGGPKEYRVDLAPAPTGTWTDFEFQIYFDRAGKGWVDAYVNGKQVVNHYAPACGTIYPSPFAEFTILRLGYYRDPAISTPGTVIHDEYRMGPTRSSVSLHA